jgi:hypothetical protein
MRKLYIFNNVLTNSILWGVIGGLAIILFAIIHTGAVIMAAYVLFSVVPILTLNAGNTRMANRQLFITGWLAFMIMTVIAFLNTSFFTATPTSQLDLGYYIKIVPIMIGVGVFTSAFITLLVSNNPVSPHLKPRFKSPVFSGLVWGFIGGLMLIVIQKVTDSSGLGWFLMAYAVCQGLSLLTLDIRTAKGRFLRVFIAALITYAFMTLILFLNNLSIYKEAGNEFPLVPYLKSLVMSLIWGLLSSILLGFIASRRR